MTIDEKIRYTASECWRAEEEVGQMVYYLVETLLTATILCQIEPEQNTILLEKCLYNCP